MGLVYGSASKKLFSIIPPYEFDTNIAKRVAPLTVVYVLMLAFNNLCLQYVEVTFYQVARSLSIHFSILFTYVILGKKTSTAAIGACAIVFLGFVIGSYGEINFSWEGLIYGVGSSAFVALYGIYVQKSLAIVDNNQWRLLHYNTTLSTIILLPMVLFSGEVTEILENVQFLDEFGFWLLMVRPLMGLAKKLIYFHADGVNFYNARPLLLQPDLGLTLPCFCKSNIHLP